MLYILSFLTSGLAVCSCRFLQRISGQVSLAFAGVQLKQSLLQQTELLCPFCSKQWFFPVLPTKPISPLAPERRREKKSDTSPDVCGNANFWRYWRGGRGRAHIALLIFKLLLLPGEMMRKLSCILKNSTVIKASTTSPYPWWRSGCSRGNFLQSSETMLRSSAKSSIIVLVLLHSPFYSCWRSW